MTVKMPPAVPGLLLIAFLLETHHFPPVSLHMCQRKVGNPFLVVPFGTIQATDLWQSRTPAEEHQTVFVAIPVWVKA